MPTPLPARAPPRARSARPASAGAPGATERRSTACRRDRARGRPGRTRGCGCRRARGPRRASGRRAAAARRARDFAARALELAAEATHEQCDLRPLARGCRTFVAEFARVGDELDGMALAALEKLLAELEVLSASKLSPAEAGQRLADAVRALSVAADRPRPGRVHVADYRSGGFSGRGHTYLLGLDEARHPGDDLEDPVLLDDERRAINRILAPAALALHRDRPRDAALALRACVSRLTGALTASYSSWKLRSLDQQSEQFPSPFFLDLYRASSGSGDADYTALLAALPVPAGFAPGVDAALDDTEWWLSRLRDAGLAAAAAPPLRSSGRSIPPWPTATARKPRAIRSVHDLGRVRRSGTPELDPRTSGQPQSASRMETLAQCPFRYFLKHVLRIEPPEEVERDTTRWLDPMKAGSLLHEVFRVFSSRSPPRRKARRRAPRRTDRRTGRSRDRFLAGKDPPGERARFEERRQEILLAAGRSCAWRRSTAGPWSRATSRWRSGCPGPNPAPRSPVPTPSRSPSGRETRFCCAARSTAWTRRPTAPSTSGTTRREAPTGTGPNAASTAAARSSTRSTPWPSSSCWPARDRWRKSRARAISSRAERERGRGCRSRSIPRGRARSRVAAGSAARRRLSARDRQGRLQVLRLRVRLRRRESLAPSHAGEDGRLAAARASGVPGDP